MSLGSLRNRITEYWILSSRNERRLTVIATVAVFLVLIFLVILISSKRPSENYCTTGPCIIEAAKLVQRIDPKTHPCDDFYQFACGTYLENAHGDSDLDPNQLLQDEAERQIHELYMEPILEHDHVMVKTEKRFFQACMDGSEMFIYVYSERVRIIKEAFKALNGWPLLEGIEWDEAKFDWLQATYKLRELGYPFDIFLDLLVSPDPRNFSRYVLEVSLPALPYGSDRKEVMMNHTRLIESYFGAASIDAEPMYEFEEKLKSAISVYSRKPPNLLTVEDFQAKYESVNWLQLINNISGPAAQISKETSVIVPQLDALRKRLDAIASTSKRTQANYLMFRVVEKLLPYLTERQETRKDQARYCFAQVHKSFEPPPSYIIYARKYLPTFRKRHIERLTMDIKNELLRLIDKVDWFQDEDKRLQKETVEKMTTTVGHIGDYFDDRVLDELNVDMKTISDENFLSLLVQANKNHRSQFYGRINKWKNEELPRYHRDWFFITPSISYEINSDNLHIPTVLLGTNIFDESRPNYLNYGILGTAVAKLFSKMITTKPSSFDRERYNVVGWSDKTEENINTLKQCINASMERSSTQWDLSLGRTILFEIIGARLSYDSYKTWVHDNNEEPKLIATKFTPNQLFWISTVTCHPENIYDEHRNTGHSLVDLIIRNNPDFSKDFNCPIGSKMNPTTKCINF